MNAEMDISKNQWRSTGGKARNLCKIFSLVSSKKNLPPEEAERKQVFFSFSDSNKQKKIKIKGFQKVLRPTNGKKANLSKTMAEMKNFQS